MNHIFPGMGATNAMYSGPWRELPDTLFHDWPHDFPGTTIGELAEAIIAGHGIQSGDTIIGSSLGGMVACEIASCIEAGRLVLIGSALHPREVNGLLNLLSHLIGYAPLEFIQRASGKIPAELSQMFAEGDSQFIRNMCKAVFSWPGLQRSVPCLRIHGSRDLVIPPPTDVDVRIPGGHLIAMTHPQECVGAIRTWLGS